MSKTTSLIPETTIPSNDSKVIDAIEATFKRALGETDSTYTAGIRNADGIVYRKVIMDSFDQLLTLSDRLSKLRFTEELDEDGGLIDGFDATYRQP
ncbi:hypothetical protein [Comamonas sp. A7-5]|uniref:hypothetical protein n=1 Tax=Comamonas sp. A7-5 TaxID=673549 RepID=UPI0031DC1033